ncbi:MAG: hypothetical protein R2788_06925 [Saprospiraceae bacterium]
MMCRFLPRNISFIFMSNFEIIIKVVRLFGQSGGVGIFLFDRKYVSTKIYHQLSFERDYKSYFPIAATISKQYRKLRGAQSIKYWRHRHYQNKELIPPMVF